MAIVPLCDKYKVEVVIPDSKLKKNKEGRYKWAKNESSVNFIREKHNGNRII